MYVPRRQRGVTFLGWIAILLLAIGAGYVAIQTGPVYANYLTLVDVVESVQRDPTLEGRPMREIRLALNTRMRLNEVDVIGNDQRGKDVVDLSRPGGDLVMVIDYWVEKPLVGNMYLLMKFYKRVGP